MKLLVDNFYYYIRLALSIVKNNVLSQSQYRTSILIRFFGTFAELATMLLFFKIIYSKVNSINEWSFLQIIVLTLIFDFTRNILLGCLVKNLPKLEDILVNGKFDLYLTKPVDTQFFVSFQQLSLGHLIQACVPLAILLFLYSTNNSLQTNVENLFLLSLNVACGIMIGYSLWIVIMSLTFFIIKVKSLHEIYLNLLQLGKYPSSIYPNWIRAGLKYLFPIFIVAVLPSEIFLGISPRTSTLFIILATIIVFYLGRKAWNFGVSNYESAGG